jgi:hypothetical protein
MYSTIRSTMPSKRSRGMLAWKLGIARGRGAAWTRGTGPASWARTSAIVAEAAA